MRVLQNVRGRQYSLVLLELELCARTPAPWSDQPNLVFKAPNRYLANINILFDILKVFYRIDTVFGSSNMD